LLFVHQLFTFLSGRAVQFFEILGSRRTTVRVLVVGLLSGQSILNLPILELNSPTFLVQNWLVWLSLPLIFNLKTDRIIIRSIFVQ
jgi:hypothetical protein